MKPRKFGATTDPEFLSEAPFFQRGIVSFLDLDPCEMGFVVRGLARELELPPFYTRQVGMCRPGRRSDSCSGSRSASWPWLSLPTGADR